MKWSIQQLMKYTQNPFIFFEKSDFGEYAKEIDDIISIDEVSINGKVIHLYDYRFQFDLTISTVLYLEDARTLESVEYPVELNVTEIFDKVGNEEDDIRLIEKNTIDLKDVVWENILLEKPIRVVKEE